MQLGEVKCWERDLLFSPSLQFYPQGRASTWSCELVQAAKTEINSISLDRRIRKGSVSWSERLGEILGGREPETVLLILCVNLK